MWCPGCAASTEVMDTRDADHGVRPPQLVVWPDWAPPTVRRRRRCTGCGARFTTFELSVETINRLMASVEVNDRMRARLGRELADCALDALCRGSER